MGLLDIGSTASFLGLIMSDNGQLWWSNQPNYHNSANSAAKTVADRVKLELVITLGKFLKLK